MSLKKVSVIMSTKDTDKKILKQSVDSILNQTYTNFEFLITCDGSEQDYEVLKEYKDKRIKIIKNEKSIGLTKALNKMIKKAKGEYIARMDSDDISMENRLEIEVNYLNKHQDVNICSTYFKFIGDKNGLAITPFTNSEEIKAELFITNRICHPAVMMRKSFLEKNNVFYDESFIYTQDYELWSRICHISKMEIIPQVCLCYRVHNKQISTAKLEIQSSLCDRIYKKNLENLKIKARDNHFKYMQCLNFKKMDGITKEELESFINLVLKENEIKRVYNQKIFARLLYYRFFAVAYKQFSIKELIIYAYKANILKVALKKFYFKIKFTIKNI